MTDQRPIGYWLKLVDGLIDEQFATTLEEHGVTRRQWQLLNVLSQGGATVERLNEAIAPFLAADEESSSEHLTELIDSGWVDATAAGYETTDRGHAAFTRLAEVVAENRARVAKGVAEADYRTTVATLEQMAFNLGFTAPS